MTNGIVRMEEAVIRSDKNSEPKRYASLCE